MPRPASGADKKLKAAAIKIIRTRGFNGLVVREVCREAGVNIGMFHYYFGSKEKFLNEIVREMYSDFMRSFRTGVDSGENPRESLKNALVEIGRFFGSVVPVIPAFLSDMLSANRKFFRFVRRNFTGHIEYIVPLAERCRPDSVFRDKSLPFLVASLAPAMVFPAIIEAVAVRNGVAGLLGRSVGELHEELYSEDALRERAEAVLKGVGL